MTAMLPRVMIAATASGGGKTTVACALLRALTLRGLRPAAFKCGPDYIDPMFHTRALGIPSRNLDLFLGDAPLARRLLAQNAAGRDLALLEGVMGFYDGLAGRSDVASSWDLACATATPVVLVVDGAGSSVSIAAQVKGFLTFRPDSHIAAVLLNRVSAALFPDLKALIERETGLPVLGHLPRLPDCTIESRHLGLVTVDEITNLQPKLDRLGQAALSCIDLDALLALAKNAPPLAYEPCELPPAASVRVAVARDEAFCFYYQDTLDLLTALGAELVSFSPLRDPSLPEGCAGLLLGGGYPELHAAALAANRPLLQELRAAISEGLPTIAECGGFLYLHRRLADLGGQFYPMVDLLDAEAQSAGRLTRFGYATLQAQGDGLLGPAGTALRVHEFHYWDSTACGDAFAACKPLRDTAWRCAHHTPTLYAGFPHLYLPAQPASAAAFLSRCAAYQGRFYCGNHA